MFRMGICNELFEGWPFERVCRTVRELGYTGLEIAPFTIAPKITDVGQERLREIARILGDEGLATIGLHWLLAKTEGFYLTSPDSAVRRRTADYLVALAEATVELGGGLMVLGSPKQRDLLPGVTDAQATDYAVEVFDSILPRFAALNVDLCLEPLAPSETNFLNTCEQAMAVIQRVGHPNLKLHMDVKAQSSETGETVPGLVEAYARDAGHVHVNDENLRSPWVRERRSNGSSQHRPSVPGGKDYGNAGLHTRSLGATALAGRRAKRLSGPDRSEWGHAPLSGRATIPPPREQRREVLRIIAAKDDRENIEKCVKAPPAAAPSTGSGDARLLAPRASHRSPSRSARRPVP